MPSPRIPQEVNKIFGANVARLRKAQGLSQLQLANKLGQSGNGSISQIERGNRGVGPSLGQHLAEVLGTSEAELRKPYEGDE